MRNLLAISKGGLANTCLRAKSLIGRSCPRILGIRKVWISLISVGRKMNHGGGLAGLFSLAIRGKIAFQERALEELLKDYSDEELLRIHPHGWSKWDEYSRADTVEYIEYLNFGPGSDLRYRVKWKELHGRLEEIAEQFSVGLF
ncbi:hypothetical protein ACLB2K_005492 [Fragaria x ananassa]